MIKNGIPTKSKNVISKQHVFLVFLAILLIACRAITPLYPKPEDLTVTTDSEFTLAPGQKAILTDTGFSVQLIGVGSDQRCPSKIECAASGPVSVSLFVQAADGTPIKMDLQTFTGNDGRAPEMQFEGIKSQADYDGYVIQIKGVLPYPAESFNEIKDSDYRVTLLITPE